MAVAASSPGATAHLTRVFTEELSCPVCLEELKEPKCLPSCAHNVCKVCLESMARCDPEIIRCPTCRRVSPIPAEGVNSLPTNTVLVKFLEVAPGRKERLQIQKSLAESKPVVEQIERRVAALDRSLENLHIKWKKAEEDIHLTAKNLTELIKTQESKFCDDTRDVCSKKQKYFQHQRYNLATLLTSASSCVQLAENLLLKGDVNELSEMTDALTQQLQEIAQMNFEESGDLQCRYEEELVFYSNHDLKTLLEKKWFGEVKSRMIERKPSSLRDSLACRDLSKIGTVIKRIGRKGCSKGYFKSPGGLAADSRGKIAVADYFNNRVEVFNECGKFLFQFGKKGSADGQFLGPTGIAYSSGGGIIVLDSKNYRVQVFDSAGQFLSKFGKQGSNCGEFGWAEGISLDAEDNILVTDTENNRVQVFSPDGTFVRQFGGCGTEGFDSPLGTICHNGEFYTTDKGNSCIKVFDDNGVYVRQFGREGSGGGELRCPRGIAVDKLNNCILVCDSENHCVNVFKTDGAFITRFETKRTPVGIALLNERNVAVSSYYGHCIQIFSYE